MPLFRPRAIVAAGAPIVASGIGDPGALGKSAANAPGSVGLADPRQVHAWDVYDRVGPVAYAQRYSASVMRRVHYFAAFKDPDNPDGDPVPAHLACQEQPDGGPPLCSEQEAADAQEAVARIQHDTEGQGGIIYAHALNLLVAGDCYTVQEPQDDGTDRWRVYSVVAISRRKQSGMSVTTGGSGWWVPDESGRGSRELSGDSYIVRTFQQHPRDPRRADSALMHVLEDCEEYYYLSRAVRGTARSRIAGAGLFLLPSEIEIPPDPDNQDEMARKVGSAQSLLRRIARGMAAAIKDETSPDSTVPPILQGPGQTLQYARHLTFDRPLDPVLAAERERRLKVIAVGLDLPQERLSIEGLADNNHWSGAQVAENEWNGHLAPLAEVICGNWTVTLLRPQLAQLGYTLEQQERWVVDSDPTNAIEKPDKSSNAQQAHDRFTISDAALRKYSGFDEDDAPAPDEIAARVERQRLVHSRSLGGPEQIPSGDVSPDGTGGTPPPPAPAPAAEPAPSGDPGQTAPVRASGASMSRSETLEAAARLRWLADLARNDPARLRRLEQAGQQRTITAAATTRRRQLGTKLADLDEQLLRRVLTGADAAMRRELDKAGSRLQSAAARRGVVAAGTRRAAVEALSQVPRRQIAGKLGRDTVQTLIASAGDPFDGAFDEYCDQVDGWVADTNQRSKDLVLAAAGALAARRGLAASPITAAALTEWQTAQQQNAVAGRTALQTALLEQAAFRLFDPDPRVDDRGEYDPDATVSASVVRPALSLYGGGSTLGDGPGGSIPAGTLLVAGGAAILGLARTGGLTFTAYEWRHGNPLHPFEPHENLDGSVFDNFGDGQLGIDDRYAWIESLTGGFYPGDHTGCTCLVGLIFGEGDDL